MRTGKECGVPVWLWPGLPLRTPIFRKHALRLPPHQVTLLFRRRNGKEREAGGAARGGGRSEANVIFTQPSEAFRFHEAGKHFKAATSPPATVCPVCPPAFVGRRVVSPISSSFPEPSSLSPLKGVALCPASCSERVKDLPVAAEQLQPPDSLSLARFLSFTQRVSHLPCGCGEPCGYSSSSEAPIPTPG